MRRLLIALAGVVALAFGMAAPAKALTYGFIPGPGAGVNDGLLPIYGSNDPRGGWYGASIYLLGGPADIEVRYHGSEACFNNSFHWGAAPAAPALATTPGCAEAPDFSLTGTVIGTFNSVASGLLSFFFRSPLGDAVNGANPDAAAGQPGPNFFATFDDPLAAFGQRVWLWFDDGGANVDDNHDDMVISIAIRGGSVVTPVPVPAALPLLGLGLGVFGLMGLRRRRRAA